MLHKEILLNIHFEPYLITEDRKHRHFDKSKDNRVKYIVVFVSYNTTKCEN